MEVDVRRLKELRAMRLLSQEELHRKSGVARDTISRLERGEHTGAQYKTLGRLARALEVDVRELVKEDDGD